MKRSEVKRLLFEQFERRCAEVDKLRDELQEQVNKAAAQLLHEYGGVALAVLKDLTLSVSAKLPAKKLKPATVPVKAAPKDLAEQMVKMRAERKHRKRRRRTTINVSELLRKEVPAAVSALVKKNEPFTSRDVYEQLVSSGVNKQVKVSHVSLFLTKNAKGLDLKVSKKMAGKPIAKPTNFFTWKKTRAKGS